MGELTELGLKPHSPYYGSADATPLWLILLSEYWRWTGDEKLVGALRRQRAGGARLDRPVRRSGRRRLRRVPDALVAGPRQPVLARLVRRRPVRRRDDPVPADRDRRDPGVRLRRQAPAGRAGRRSVGGPRPGDTAPQRGGGPARALQARLLDRRARRLLRHRARRRQAPDRLADLEHRPAALVGDRVRGARGRSWRGS